MICLVYFIGGRNTGIGRLIIILLRNDEQVTVVDYYEVPHLTLWLTALFLSCKHRVKHKCYRNDRSYHLLCLSGHLHYLHFRWKFMEASMEASRFHGSAEAFTEVTSTETLK